jgi:hypothetical protein
MAFRQDVGVEFEYTFRDGAGPADVEMTVAGVPTPEGFRLMNERLTADPRFRPGLTMLVDCSALDTSGLSNEEVQELSERIVERDMDYAPSAVALIAPDEQTFSAVRAYRAHVGGSKSHRYLFGSRAEAVAWLEAQQA